MTTDQVLALVIFFPGCWFLGRYEIADWWQAFQSRRRARAEAQRARYWRSHHIGRL